jgi:LysR family transcriptional regulator for bpeEF and oprC
VVTAELGSFRAAARKLGVTPSAVSKAIGRLAGCQQAVVSVRDAREKLAHTQRVPRGRLRVSLPLMLGRSLLPRISSLLERYPDLVLDAVLTDRFVDFAQESVDAAVRIGMLQESQASMRRLRSVCWVTVASPRYLARRGVPKQPADLTRHDCLAFTTPTGVQQNWEFRVPAPELVLETFRPGCRLVADHGEALVLTAIAGAGVFQAHDYTVETALETGQLTEVLAPFAAPGPPISLLYAPGRRSSAKVRAFADIIVELLGAK